MADFQAALKITLENEGGFNYAKRPDGTVEVVNMGVTLETLRRLHFRTGPIPTTVGNVTAIDVDFVKSMTVDFVSRIYKPYYWDPLCLDAIEDQNLAQQLFDLSVNVGPHWPALWLQRAVGVTGDGEIGPLTLAAVRDADPLMTNVAVRHSAALFYGEAQPAADRPRWLARLAKMGKLAGLPVDV